MSDAESVATIEQRLQASDPQTPLEALAELAYKHPELRALVAANPSSYQGLLDWLRQFDDPDIGRALAQRSPGSATIHAAERSPDPVAATESTPMPVVQDDNVPIGQRVSLAALLRRPGSWIAAGAIAAVVIVAIIVASVTATNSREQAAETARLSASQQSTADARDTPTPAQSTPTPTPDETSVKAQVPTNSFSGPIRVVDRDGYTFQLDFRVTPAGSAKAEVANEKPGFSTVTQLLSVSDVTLKNTTPGRNLEFSLVDGITFPQSSPHIVIAALYPIASPVCTVGANSAAGSAIPYCYVVATDSYVAHTSTSETEFAPDQARKLTTYVGVGNVGNYFSVAGVPDASLSQVQAALSSPAGWAVIYSGKDASYRFAAQTCGTDDSKSWATGTNIFGLTVLGSSPDGLNCVGAVNWLQVHGAS